MRAGQGLWGGGVGWFGGVYYFERQVFMEKSNARPPSATFYHTAIPRTKGLKRSEGTEGENICSRDT